jgi:hypothetical protein
MGDFSYTWATFASSLYCFERMNEPNEIVTFWTTFCSSNILKITFKRFLRYSRFSRGFDGDVFGLSNLPLLCLAIVLATFQKNWANFFSNVLRPYF